MVTDVLSLVSFIRTKCQKAFLYEKSNDRKLVKMHDKQSFNFIVSKFQKRKVLQLYQDQLRSFVTSYNEWLINTGIVIV